ncbi:hypothetical protein [Archangium lansingense]|uniref:Uncharacterized protein n=1 Tax=Archangium lansingense TaxID=2995310 RepID=A0ABT4ADM4_9BACT|nr:hypothetical protein [Archangium lansinium]MCY1079771.1 hypothetical protein [Archangium lansinium]
MRKLLLSSALLLSLPAAAWESVCYEQKDPTKEVGEYPRGSGSYCAPAAGPNTARHRWVGELDEHRQLWELTREKAGLPAETSATARLRVFTSSQPLNVDGQQLTSLLPVPFAETARVQVRAFTPGELAQLPDFSYALWDWATGHETCPLPGIGADATQCHDFATHMGPVNSNHFVPQAGRFYAHYHGLALARARECKAMKDALGAAGGRYGDYLRACETEALALEAVGHHYLQDAWSMGHMWQRWGSPELSDFPSGGDDPRDKAVLIALASGLLHGARGVLQRLPEWTSYDVNDALCAPHPSVEFVSPGGARYPAIGDDYLHLLGQGSTYAPQSERLLSCAVSGMREVYAAAGENHGALGAPADGLRTLDPTGPECFGQRATNRSMLEAAAVQFRIVGQQVTLGLDSRVVGWIIPTVAHETGEVPVPTRLKNQFRLEMQRIVSLTRLLAKERPEGTELADGRFGSFLGAKPNGEYASGGVLASYIDPVLPWPSTPDTLPEAGERALALARVFHRGHSADWCRTSSSDGLEALRARASDVSLDAPTRAAACEVCSEFARRHLRVGTSPASYDTSAEPLCHYLSGGPYLYQSGPGTSGELANTWCGCP